MTAVALPADRRFRRAHLKPARRRQRWKTMTVAALRYAVVVAGVGYAGYRGSIIVAHARVLPVDRVVVSGNERLSTNDVLAVLAGLRGESLLWTNLERWRQRLLASPWIRDAALHRALPATVEVFVWERRPMGIARVDRGTYLVDQTGAIIDEFGPQYADLDLPIIDGLARSPAARGSMTDEGRAELAARVIAAVASKPDVARKLSQIDVSDVHDAAVILSGDQAVVRLGEEKFLPRLESYLQVAPTLRERVPDIDTVDLRFDERIYVRPAKGARQPPTAHPAAKIAPVPVRARARVGHGTRKRQTERR